MHDDLPVVRQYAEEVCLRDGQIPCRWTRELGYGYGYPLMNFYPPLPYFVGLIPRALGLSFIDTIKILFILSLVISAGFMAKLCSLFFDRWGAVAGALLYLYGPYHALNLYVRGDLNELWAMAFFPAVLWASYKLIKKPTLHRVLILSGSFAGIILSHVGMTLIMTPVMLIWISLWLIVKNFKDIKRTALFLAFSGLFSVGLSAFFILPVLYEQQLVHVNTLTMGYFNFLAHFVDLNQLFLSRYWGYGASVYGPLDEMGFQIGLLHWVVGLIALVGLLSWWKKNRPLFFSFIFFFVLFLASAFMAHWKATPIWLRIPKLDFLQFPWRFLALVLPAVSFLAASVFTLIPNRFRPISVSLLLLLLLLLYGGYFQPEKWFYDRTDKIQFSGKIWQKALTAGIFDYLPIWSKMPPANPPAGDVEVTPGIFATTNYKSSNYQSFEINNLNQSATSIKINTLYYPGWTVTVNSLTAAANVTTGGDLGLIGLVVPPGRSNVTLRFTETPLRFFSDVLSAMSWLILVVYLAKMFNIGKANHTTSALHLEG